MSGRLKVRASGGMSGQGLLATLRRCGNAPRKHSVCLREAVQCLRKGSSGQATVEYLIVGLALIAIIVALGVFSGRLGEGLFVQHAVGSASHAFTTNTAGSTGDVLLY